VGKHFPLSSWSATFGRVVIRLKYYIDGTEVGRDAAVEYFVKNSGFAKKDAEQLFGEEEPEFIEENCSGLEIRME
jgi:hypothetical protein